MIAAVLVIASVTPTRAADLRTAPDILGSGNTVVRTMVFPVAGQAGFWNDWHAPRDNGERLHLGTDILAPKLTPVLAAVDGVVTRADATAQGTAGNFIVIEDTDGWGYAYLHLNNDSPGTDDNSNPERWGLARDLDVGSEVLAGQLIGFVGDSGNAETSVPHIHFEIRSPDGTKVDPYPSLDSAWQADPDRRCLEHSSDADGHAGVTPSPQPRLVVSAGGAVIALDGAIGYGDVSNIGLDAPIVAAALTRTGRGYWLLGADGGVFSFGDAAFHGSIRSADTESGASSDITAAIDRHERLQFNGQIRAVDIVTASGDGYWIVLANGLAIEFGESSRTMRPPVELAEPAVQLIPSSTTGGFWLLAADGGVFALNGAPYHGSLPERLADHGAAISMLPTVAEDGYGIVDDRGALYAFGRYQQYGVSNLDGACTTGSIAAAIGIGESGHHVLTSSGHIRAVGDSQRPLDDIAVPDAVDVLATRWP